MGIIAAQKDIIASNLNKMAEATTAKLTPILPIPSNLPNLPKCQVYQHYQIKPR
jgi:hypothetical protein